MLRAIASEPNLPLDTAAGLARFDRPALVIWAERDRVMPPDHGRRLAALLPGGRLVEVPDSYTLIPLDQPASLARLVRDFATEPSSPTSGVGGVMPLVKALKPIVVAALALVAVLANAGPAQAAVEPRSYKVTATLDGRTAKDLSNHAHPDRYPVNTAVTVTCQDSGPDAYGSPVWDRTSDGFWVPDRYVKTGHAGFTDELPRCVRGTAPTGTPVGHAFTISATLDGRRVKDLADHAFPDKYRRGSTAWVTCQDTGPNAYGSPLWDYTSHGLWIPDYYVRTGSTGFGKGVARCESGEPVKEQPRGPRSCPVTALLHGRTAKDVANHAFPDKYPAGSSVQVVCQDTGASAYGSKVWDLTSDGLWVPDFYVRTGSSTFSPLLDRCALTKPFRVTTSLDGRTVRDVANHAYRDKYAANSTVYVKCQAYGGLTYGGSSLWDFTTDNLWIVDYYVKTGTDGPVQGLPRCNSTPPSGTSNPKPPSSRPPPVTTQPTKVATAIAAARSQITKHPLYAWGGGHSASPGASRGYCDSVNGYLNGQCVASHRIGFDCSGLMRWVFFKATGADWGNLGTFRLFNRRPAVFGSTVLSLPDLKPGDLVLSDSDHNGSVNHTGLVSAVSGSRVTMIEAPRTSIPLREHLLDPTTFLKAYRLS